MFFSSSSSSGCYFAMRACELDEDGCATTDPLRVCGWSLSIYIYCYVAVVFNKEIYVAIPNECYTRCACKYIKINEGGVHVIRF